jgi:hypothetical protein
VLSILWTASALRGWRGRCSGGSINEKARQIVSLAGAAATENLSGDLPNAEKRFDPELSPSSRGAGGSGDELERLDEIFAIEHPFKARHYH